MNIEAECIETTELRKPEKHGCSPCATDTLFKFSLFILNSQLKNEFLFATNIAYKNHISKYFLIFAKKAFPIVFPLNFARSAIIPSKFASTISVQILSHSLKWRWSI